MASSQSNVRVRIAPSPTGAPHIGTAYIALFNYAFARRAGGKFILRIEDTDRARCTRESEDAILEALRWVGLSWDEGPDMGGDHAPYRQSERLALYREQCQVLVEAGHAYPCFCSVERLNQLRAEQIAAKANPGYDGHCEALSPAEARQRQAAGEPHVVRMKIPQEGDCVFSDLIRGEIRIPWSAVDRQVLLKSDGFPTYHLANVVDDHFMRISHVIRGEEWISSTPKHVLLYRYFGWTPPEFVHLPLLRNPDKSKLSKRKNPTGILYYRDAGYLPEALLNYLGLMAYSMPDGREIFSCAELAQEFDLARVSLGGPVFDLAKLTHFNGQYLRHLSAEELAGRLAGWKINANTWQRILPLAQPRLETLADLVPMTAHFFADRPAYPPEQLVAARMDGMGVARLLKLAQWSLEQSPHWNAATIREILSSLAEREGLKFKSMLLPFFVALSGSATSLPLFESMEIIGREMVMRRLAYAQEALAGLGFVLKGKELNPEFAFKKQTQGLTD